MLTLVIAAALFTAAFSWRYAWWRPTADYHYPRILMYHMIAEHRPGARFNGLRVPPAQFAKQVQWLREDGWQFFTMSELQALGASAPAKSVALTFDDGYADNLHAALPVLKQFNAKATIYVVVDRHNRDWSVYKKSHHTGGELAAEPKLSDDDIHTLLASGLIELGSHTLTHVNLATADETSCQRELQASREQLQQQFGVPVTSLAYPFGIWSPRDAEMALQCGYHNAVTTDDGLVTSWQAPFALRRVKISGKEGLFSFRLRLRTGRRKA